MSVSNIRALFENMLFLSKSLEFDTKWMVSKHFLRIFFLFLGIEDCWEFWEMIRKQVFPKEWVSDPHLLWKNVQKSKENRKNNWKKTTSTSPISLKSCETKENTLYHFNYISLTYSKTHKFKYKIPTQKQKYTHYVL